MENSNLGANKFYMGKNNIILPSNPITEEMDKIRMTKEADELAVKLLEAAKAKQKEIDDKMETLEVLPMFNKVIILPYPVNPYKKIITNAGIIVEYDGSFMNPDSGTKDKLQEFVKCAKIIEVGAECKYVKVDDDVFYDSRTTYPFPFLNLGYEVTSETQLVAILNEGLKTRFNMK